MVIEIAPSDLLVVVRAQLRPDQIDDVYRGMVAEVRLTAYPYRTTPILKGNIVQISADRFTVECTGVAYYDMRIEVPTTELHRLPDADLTQACRPRLMVPLRKSTALDYLVEPLLCSIEGTARADCSSPADCKQDRPEPEPGRRQSGQKRIPPLPAPQQPIARPPAVT